MTKKSKAQNHIQQRVNDEDWFNDGVEWSHGHAYKNEDSTHKGYKTLTVVDKEKEKEFGNRMIGQVNNTQFTTVLGEGLVFAELFRQGKNPRRPLKKEGKIPDIETDDAIYEVKTRNWTTSGTAGEKVLGAPFKYAEVPRLYNKPLKIVLVAYQEYECCNGSSISIFGNISEEKQRMLKFYKDEFQIEYIKFSDLIKN